MSSILESIRSEFARYRQLGEGAIAQLKDTDLSTPGPNGTNSIAVVTWHISGNLQSRFTDFLTTDGEKPWRHREEEFQARTVTRDELVTKWNKGWETLFAAIDPLTEAQLATVVTIRHMPHHVHEALHRSLAHVAYHVGQIVYLAKALRGSEWKYLSIPPGQSDAVNKEMEAKYRTPAV